MPMSMSGDFFIRNNDYVQYLGGGNQKGVGGISRSHFVYQLSMMLLNLLNFSNRFL